jgi:hypothetical protein
MRKSAGVLLLVFACSITIWAQGTVPARIVVTIGHYYGPKIPLIEANNLTITQGVTPLTITSVTPLRGPHAGLELFILVDNCSSCEVGSNFDELRKFIAAQPATTSVGVAYIQDGRLQMVENLTTDRERATRALSQPYGSRALSPYGALADLITNWKPRSPRRVVLMISTGFDPAAVNRQSESKSAEAAIEAAQRHSVTVYAIYHPSFDYATTAQDKLYSGQVLLSHVAEETGGEAYYLGFGPLTSLAPFLADINHHLANQYLVEFLGNPGSSVGELQDVVVKSNVPGLDLMAPYRISVAPNGTSGQKPKGAPVQY